MKYGNLIYLLLGVAATASAQQMGDHGMAGDQAGAGAMMGSGKPGAGATTLTEGEIRKVDKKAKKVTIRHGAIAHIDMPPMTMVYQVKDAALLDRVKAGDKIKFAAEKIGGAYVVTAIEPAR